MKHLIVTTASIAAVVILCGAAIHQHNSYVSQQVSAHARTVTAQVKAQVQLQTQAKATQLKLEEANKQITKLQAQCEAGAKDYTLLTPYAKTLATVPTCSLQNSAGANIVQ